MSDERRIAERVNTQPDAVSVINTVTELDLGTIANLSSTGFMLVSSEIIEIDSVFQLEFRSVKLEEPLHLGAVCLWNADASSATAHWSGFHIIDISDANQQALDLLVKQLSGS